MQFHICRIIVACLSLYLAPSVLADEASLQDSSEQLDDVRMIIKPIIESNKTAQLFNRKLNNLADALRTSRWRHSFPHVIRLLIESRDPQDRIAGWQLARFYDGAMKWRDSDIERVINDASDEVKVEALITIVSKKTPAGKECIERLLRDPMASDRVKKACVQRISDLPSEQQREQLWLLAAENDAFREECLSSFSSVKFSQAATRIVVGYLDDTGEISVAVSDHFSVPTEVRTLACEELSTATVHKDFVLEELQKRCEKAPQLSDLDFFIAAIMAIHILNPESNTPVDLISKWHDALPATWPVLLQRFAEPFSVSDRLEALVILHMQRDSPDARSCACQWLSCRRSRRATTELTKLLSDPHAGVRLAAAVSLCKIDPRFDLKRTREEILQHVVSSSDEVLISFDSLNDAIAALALAGQSDVEALRWLKQKRSPKLQTACHEAAENLSADLNLGLVRFIPWKVATVIQP